MDEEAKDLTVETDVKASSDDESKSAISADLIRGHINTIILRTLYDRDKYGYEIIEEIENKSHGQYSLKQPTLYSALKRLESQGYINAYWKTDEVSLGGRRKYYTLTDSGREITEKNQAEWEYSRTVIDNLISDRSFDFSQPAPAASVDFKILKKSTSRVPVIKGDGEDDDEDDEEEISLTEEKSEIEVKTVDKQSEQKVAVMPEVEIKEETVTFTASDIIYCDPPVQTTNEANKPPVVEPASSASHIPEQNVVSQNDQVYSNPQNQQPYSSPNIQQAYSAPQNEQRTYIQNEKYTMDEEQRRIVHENYLRLISEPIPEPPKEVDVVPVAEDIDTDKLIYNNKPETERDYKNLINNLFNKTVNHKHPVENTVKYEQPAPATEKFEDISSKAEQDGLKVNSSEFVVATRKKSYNRGGTLFKSSLIISIILLLEFTLCLLFKNELGVGLAYPFVILALAASQLLIFGVLYYTDIGKTSRKPTSTAYISACIIITVILLFIIFIVSLLLGVNFASAGDIIAKIIIPCLVALNIPVFAVCFYAFSK